MKDITTFTEDHGAYKLITWLWKGIHVAHVYSYDMQDVFQIKQLSTIEAGTHQGIGEKILASIYRQSILENKTIIVSSWHGAVGFYRRTLKKLHIKWTEREIPSLFDAGYMMTEFII